MERLKARERFILGVEETEDVPPGEIEFQGGDEHGD